MSRLFGNIRQMAMVVTDAEATMREWVRFGVGPFFVFRNFEVHDYRYLGKPEAGPLLTLGFAHSGDLQIEIIQQHNEVPSGYRDFLLEGHAGVHHVCAWPETAQEYDRKRADLLAAGYELVHEGGTQEPIARFAYFRTTLPGGICFELSEALIPWMRPMTETVAAAAVNWDGRDPIRYVTP
jgi:catechol 2,3-dioxygenase-like lactoylglutathione lyase family enzyme